RTARKSVADRHLAVVRACDDPRIRPDRPALVEGHQDNATFVDRDDLSRYPTFGLAFDIAEIARRSSRPRRLDNTRHDLADIAIGRREIFFLNPPEECVSLHATTSPA